MSTSRIAAVILAAGKSTRMRSERPKVLHEVCGRPMLAYVLDACRQADIAACLVVVGYGKDTVMAAFAADADITWVEQKHQRGTGHAVMCCHQQLARKYDHVVLLCGDGPLIRAETIREMLERHQTESAAATLATAVLDDPNGYGRIVRDEHDSLLGIVEHGDCSAEQRRIREVNPSYYCFRVPELLAALDELRPDNIKNEYYITDAVGILIEQGHRAAAITAVPPEDVLSINSRQELARVNCVMRDRINDRLLSSGVTMIDPQSTWIDARAEIGAETVIHPFVTVDGPARIGCGCRVGPFAHVTGTEVFADDSVIRPYHGAHP